MRGAARRAEPGGRYVLLGMRRTLCTGREECKYQHLSKSVKPMRYVVIAATVPLLVPAPPNRRPSDQKQQNSYQFSSCEAQLVRVPSTRNNPSAFSNRGPSSAARPPLPVRRAIPEESCT